MVENLMGEVLDDTLHLPRPGAPLRVAPIGLGSWTGQWGLLFHHVDSRQHLVHEQIPEECELRESKLWQ